MSRHLLAASLLAATLLTIAAPAVGQANQVDHPVPLELHVLGGAWQTANDFSVRWSEDPSTRQEAVLRTRYRVYDAAGTINEDTVPYDPGTLSHLHVRPDPAGTYYVAVWFEVGRGDGPVETTAVRFDNQPPDAAKLSAPSRWLGPADSTEVAIEPPASPPVSGVRGYAMSINRGPVLSPCSGESACTEAETNLSPATRSLDFGTLPEGIYTVALCTVSGSGLRSALSTATLRIDASRPEVALASAPEGWYSRPVALTAVASDPLSGMAPSGPEGPFTAIAVDGGLPRRVFGNQAGTVVAGDGIHSVAFWGRDAGGNSGEPGVSLAAPVTATVRIDGTAPEVAFARAQDPNDPERIEATVADSLSGPDPSRGSIAVRAAGSGRAFDPLPTAVVGGHLTARWPSDDYPAGRYEFRAAGFDRAGNPAVAVSRADGSAMVLPSPLKAPVSLQFGFGGRRLVLQRCNRADGRRRCHRQVLESFADRPAARTVPSGHGVTVGGRLLSAAGAPLPHRQVEIVETFPAGARHRTRRTTLHSHSDGSFVTRLAAGPSRRVRVGFAGDRVLVRESGRELRLAVRTGVGLEVSDAHATIGGAPVIFSGRVAHPGAPIPRAGLPVELQFRLPGRAWEEFRTLQSDAAGRFRYPYSFTDDDSAGVRFLFRAQVPRSGGWPFLPGTSRPLAVTGR